MITAGVDVGSVTTKAVIMDGGRVAGKHIVPTKADPAVAAQSSFSECLKAAGMSSKQVGRIVTTGYGRRAIDFGDMAVTEISANARGAVFLGSPEGKVRTIIDLGGQDSKVISLDDGGKITRFMMNDKCSAGTGRFFEVMADTLGVKIDQLGDLSLKSSNPISINSTCTVFAESEVISLIARRNKKEDIIAGLHNSMAKRLSSMAKEVGARPVVFFDGGGAKNSGIRSALERQISEKIYVPEMPQFVVAIGAALIAGDSAKG